MLLRQIFDPALAQYSYLVGCQKTGEALIIDPERDIQRYTEEAERNGLRIVAVAETHIHADFVSGSREFSVEPGVNFYLSKEGGSDWQYAWTEGLSKVHLLADGDEFTVGKLRIRAVHTPGHTPEHLSYLITDVGGGASAPMAFATGDFLFVGDVGRPDLLESAAGVAGVMEESARTLQKALVEKLQGLPDGLLILPGHGAGSACGKSLGAVPFSSLGYERKTNHALQTAIAEPGRFVSDILAGQPEPQMYFARMKDVNKTGIEIRGEVLEPPHLTVGDFASLAAGGAVPIDTRKDGADFSDAHFRGSISAPLGGPFFSAAVGSFLDASQELLLVVSAREEVLPAVTELFRIGYDHVKGWVLTSELREAGLFGAKIARVLFPDFEKDRALETGTVVDVRTSAEFGKGHIPGAVSFPYTRIKSRLGEIPGESRVFLHCGSGRRAGLAASFLASRGYDVLHVDGICAECERIAREEGEAFR